MPKSSTPVTLEAPALGRLHGLLGYHLRIAQDASFRAFSKRTKVKHLKPQRYAMLALVSDFPGISQTALSALVGREKSSLTPAIDDLEKRNLVKRTKTEGDRRSYSLFLTPAGVKMLAVLDLHAQSHEKALESLVGTETYLQLIEVLKIIGREIEER